MSIDATCPVCGMILLGSFDDVERHKCLRRKRGRIQVADKSRRTFNDKVYDSRLEMERSYQLWLMKSHRQVGGYFEQVKMPLGDITYTVDFLVFAAKGPDSLASSLRPAWCEDVKGHETERFKLVRRLWPKYGFLPLIVLKGKPGNWKRETIFPKGMAP
jgi:hypothetical protein